MILAHLGHLATAGHEVVIKTNLINTGFLIHPRIKIEKIKWPSPLGTVLSAFFSKLHTQYVIATIIPVAFFLYPRNREKIIYFAQEFEELGYRNFFVRLLIRFLSHICLAHFKIPAIAVSTMLADFLKAAFQADVRVIPNAVDTNIYFPDPSSELFSLKGAEQVILVYARRDARKGFDLALEVVRELKRMSNSCFQIWIIGENLKMDMEGLSYRFLGHLNDEQMRRVLSSSDVFLYPSRSEGFGLIVAEAFACKCPVVTTSAVPLAEDEVNALVSDTWTVPDLASKVLRLLENTTLSKKLAEKGFDLVHDMSLSEATNRFEAAIIICGKNR